MSRRYKVEDLLRLRESPLVAKPTSLPPQEEWMGTTQDVAARRTSALRGKPDDTIFQSEGFQRRPNLLDHQRKSATASSELFLGPRKFGSGRKGNAQEEADENSKAKDYTSTQEPSKAVEDTKERFGERRGGRHDALNGRYPPRSDGDEFPNGRYRRKDDRDETEPRSRQDTEEGRERPRWRARNGQEDPGAIDEEKERSGEVGRPGQRRETQGRGKFEQPWFRNEKGNELTNERRGEARQHEWRRDRDWDRSARPEADPEWMDSVGIEEPAQAHTQEDFQRWKERMKAGGTPAEEKPDMTGKISVDAATMAEAKKVASVPSSAVLSSPEMSDAMDKFFARFGEAKPEQEQKAQTKGPSKTRFASLWNAPTEPAPAATVVAATEKASPQIQTPSQTDADQAGFARILQMLGSRNSNPIPQEQGPQKTRTPLHSNAEPQGTQDRMNSPETQPMTADLEQPPRNRTVRLQESASFDRPMGSRSPMEASHMRQESGPSKDTSEILLNLMRQANLGKQSQASQFYSNEQRQPPGLAAPVESLNRAAASRNNLTSINTSREPGIPQRRETGPSFFDEPPMSGMNFQEEQVSQDFQHNGLRRRPTNGPPPAFYDDQYLASMRQNSQQPPKAGGGNHMQGQGLPPGLNRPPGLDQMPRMPPGWPSQQQQPPQQSQPAPRQAPPPGIPNLPRGLPPPFSNSNPNMPMPQHLQQPPPPPMPGMQRPQRKYTGDSGPGFPPGMAAPPGFMNNGPPPGFPGAPQTYGRFQVGNEPQGMPRGFPDMYGNGQTERNLLRGGPGQAGNGVPGAYR